MDEQVHPDQAWEQDRFSQIMALLAQRLQAAQAESRKQMSGLTDTRRDEFTERSEPLLRNLWAAHRFEDLVHLSQEFQNAADEEKDHENTLRQIASLKKMLSSPYFARIDLRFEEDEEPEQVYIGRRSLWDDAKENLLIYDWRAPLASVFYRYGVGPASYQAPAGKITCEMLLKRQYEIQKGQLIGFFDADTVIQDSFLRRLLAQNASSQMKAIVETIQKDQDAAIRDEDHDLLMVQGAAGSGKTSIAMHRVAYLMYEGLKNPLSAHNILILSPNTVFEKYISGVLPELGQSSVSTSTLEQLLEDFLGLPVQSRSDRWEWLCAASADKAQRRQALLAFKSSRAFAALLDAYAKALPGLIPYQDLSYGGRLIADREEIRLAAMERKNAFPLAVRLSRLEQALWQRVHALRPKRIDELRMLAFRLGRGEEYARGVSIWESGVLARSMRAMTRLDFKKLYQQFLESPEWMGKLNHAPIDASLLSSSEPLPLEDAAAMAYLKLKLTFGAYSGDIKQVVVDEAQDLSPVDFACLNGLFPKARFTVVGDIHQALDHPVSQGLYEDIAATLNRKRPEKVTLNKSFRCTKEILDFSLRFLPDTVSIQSLNRSGAAPRVISNGEIAEEVAHCREAGYESIALIVKTFRDAERWLALLPREWNVRVMGRHAAVGDVFLVPLSLSKGLEFDAAVVLDCDPAHYGQEADKRLLYVACTRALHRLALAADEPISILLS